MASDDTEKRTPIIRLLIVDGHPVVREGLKLFFAQDDQIRVVAEASNGQDAIELAERLKPDVILMELGLPVIDGCRATHEILAKYPNAKILILTSEIDKTQVMQLVSNGVFGYLLKDILAQPLLDAVKGAAAGYPQYDPKVMDLLIKNKVRRGMPSQRLDQLTRREREVMHKVVAGQTYIEIGKELLVSESTIKFHVAHILQKLQLASRYQLTAFVMKHFQQYGDTLQSG